MAILGSYLPDIMHKMIQVDQKVLYSKPVCYPSHPLLFCISHPQKKTKDLKAIKINKSTYNSLPQKNLLLKQDCEVVKLLIHVKL